MTATLQGRFRLVADMVFQTAHGRMLVAELISVVVLQLQYAHSNLRRVADPYRQQSAVLLPELFRKLMVGANFIISEITHSRSKLVITWICPSGYIYDI